MGEYSKRIGEIGEEIVVEFLKIIGWTNPRLNFDIVSVDPEKHGKKTNGIDGYFHYLSPMITNTIENVIYSVKFSNDIYKGNLVNQFKDHYRDLAMAIESFKKSEIKNTTLNNHSNIEAVFDRGILFWIHNEIDSKLDLSSNLIKIELPNLFHHDGIVLMDNNRMEFIYDSVKYVKGYYASCDVQFSYFITGMNNDDRNKRNGKILPIQYLSSNIIPFRVQDDVTNKTTLVFCSNDGFSDEQLIKLMGLAKNISNNYQVSTHILFSNYNKSKHEQLVSTTKQAFGDSDFVENLKIGNFNSSFIDNN